MSTEHNRYASFYQFLEKTGDFVAILDRDGQIIRINENGRFLLALLEEDVAQLNMVDLILDGQVDFAAVLDTAVSTGSWQGELILANPEGLEVPVSAKLVANQTEAEDVDFLGFIANDTTERKWVESSLQESEIRFQGAFNNTSAGMAIISVDGRFLQINQPFCDFTGYTEAELMQSAINDILHPDHRARNTRNIDRLRTGKTNSLQEEISYIAKDGQTHWAIVNLGSIHDVNGNLLSFLMQLQDITERHKLERQIQDSLDRRSHQVRLSTQITQEIATAPNLPHLYERVVTLVKETFGYYHVQLLQHDPALDVMALVVGYGQIGEQMEAMHHSMPMGVGLIGVAAATGQTVLRPVTSDDPDWQPNPLLPDTKGEIAVPIKLGDTILGVLDVQHDAPQALDENDQILLEGLCGQIAVAIEDTQLRQEMADRLRELDTLQRYMSREGWKEYQSKKIQVNGFLYSKVGVQPIAKGAATADSPPSNNNGQTISKQPLSAGDISLPLTVRGQAIGNIGIEDDPNKPLTEQDSEFLNAIARQISEALEAARLFEQTQDALSGQEQMAAELQTVAEVSTAASTILDVDTLLQTVVELVKLRFGLYHAHIYLVDEESNSLVLRAGAGDVGQIMVLEGRNIRFNAESLVARAARTRKGFIENDVRKIVDFLPHPLLPNTRAEMAIPLIVGSRLIGVMDLQSDKVGFFGEEAMQVQRTLASQIAVAVQNATMYAVQVETTSKLREVDRLKSEFLASMSHELRTPLNSIIGFADVILEGLDGELNERMEQDVHLIKESGTHLRDLIGEILDMSKIEAGRMELRYEEIDMRQMAHDILATANPLAHEKNLEMILELDDAVGTIEADRTRLRQVLWNIMGNAIKFTEKGSVTLAITSQRDMMRIAIRDTGIGIKPEDMKLVFEQFSQVDGSLNRSVGGTGLGMPISKKLVELHGGEIGIDSVPGQGSTFWFTLPIEKPKTPRQKLGTGPLPALGTAVN